MQCILNNFIATEEKRFDIYKKSVFVPVNFPIRYLRYFSSNDFNFTFFTDMCNSIQNSPNVMLATICDRQNDI